MNKKIKHGILIFAPAIAIYLFVFGFQLIRLALIWITDEEFNPVMLDQSMETCPYVYWSPDCRPILDNLQYLVMWDSLTRLILVLQVIWWVCLGLNKVRGRIWTSTN